MHDLLIQKRFEALRARVRARGDDPDLDRPVSRWVTADDSHLPRQFLGHSARRLTEAGCWQEIGDSPGIGVAKLNRLLDLIERAIDRVETPRPTSAEQPGGRAEAFDPGALDEVGWSAWAEAVRLHRLDGLPLGRFARSLNELSASLWAVPLRRFLDLPLVEVPRLAGMGPVRVGQVLRAIAEVARAVSAMPAGSPLACRLSVERIHGIACWIDAALAARAVPTADELDRQFVRPLLAQLDADLSAEDAELIRRRWGLGGRPATLEALGREVGLTRERIRQLTEQAGRVLAVRWPEGRHLLDDFYELLLSATDAAAQRAVVRTVADACFDVVFAADGSRADLRAGWEEAGASGRTPMTEAEVRAWAAEEFPRLPPAVAVEWVAAEGVAGGEGGGPPYFSREPYDRLLLDLYRRGTALDLAAAAAAVGGDERAVRGRLARDDRFVEDDERRVWASVHRNLERVGGEWVAILSPVARIPVAHLARLAAGGLLLRGVADATIWGVRRAADELTLRLFGVGLPAAWSPTVFATLLMRHSGGAIRAMRRRRVRWDTPGGTVPPRGKRGWVAEVLVRAGGPMTMEEMDGRLRAFYQDYEGYVLAQLTDDGDGDEAASGPRFHTTSAVSRRFPKLFIPEGWSLDPTGATVSEGVRQFARRVLAAKGVFRYARAELQEAGWLVQLCEIEAGGPVVWADDP